MTTQHKKLTIPQILVLGFLSILLIGGSLLTLPIASQSGEFTHVWDAFFTAASALFVTGQVTLVTATHWSYVGKTIIIMLIEIGGLGFMTFLVLFFFLLRKKINIKEKRIIQESLNIEDISEARSLVRYVLQFSFLIQMFGAILLSFRFVPMFGWLKGVYFSIFHAISAFCNAGFDLFGDSLIGFQKDPYILTIIMALIVIGGLGFIVWRDLLTYRKNKNLLLHTRMVLVVSGVVMSIAFVLFFISETKHGTFAHLNLTDRLFNTLFLVVTPRTAGYANVDYLNVSTTGVFLTILLMFIGGSSGSTSGGFKVTTLGVLVVYLVSSFKKEQTHFQKRAISKDRVEKAMILLLIGIFIITVMILLLLFTQDFPPEFGFEAILVEVFSCFGTVGLTLGITPYLNWFGKFILIVLMFMGRVGTLTVILSMGSSDKESKIHYPEGSILIG